MAEFTSEQVDTIVSRYLEGEKSRDIAKSLRCETKDVVQVLQSRGIGLRHRMCASLPSPEEIECLKEKIRAARELAKLDTYTHQGRCVIPVCIASKHHNGHPMVDFHD
jgi:hypothetical protein